MSGNVHKLADPRLQNHFFSFLYGTQLKEKVEPSKRVKMQELYIPRDACSTFRVSKGWRKLEPVQNAQFLLWKELFMRLFHTQPDNWGSDSGFYFEKIDIVRLRSECTRKFEALAKNIRTSAPTPYIPPNFGHGHTRDVDTTGKCILWNRWLFTCPQKDQIKASTIRNVHWDFGFSAPEGHPYRDISDFRVAHGKVVARAVELSVKKEGQEEPKKEPLPKKLCFHVWDIATKQYSFWEMPGEQECRFFQILDADTLFVVKSNDKTLRLSITTGQIKTRLNRDLGGANLAESHSGMLFVAVNEVVRVFNEESGAYLNSIEPNQQSSVTHISFFQEKVVLGFWSGTPATALYDTQAKRWVVSRLIDDPQLDSMHKFTRYAPAYPRTSYARFGELLWQTSYAHEQRVYDLATEKQIRTFSITGNVGGQLFENGFGFVGNLPALKGWTFSIDHYYFDSTPAPAPEPEKKQEVKAPEALPESARPATPPPAPAPSLWTECMSYICNTLERLYNWLRSWF